MSSAIQSYLGKRDYAAYKAGTRRSGGSVPYDRYNRKRVYAPRSMSIRSNAPFPAQLRVLGKEKKSVDLPYATYTLNTTEQITPINLIRTGSTFCNRIGRKIEMKSVRVSGQLDVLRASTDVEYLRILIVYDRQPNGALPAIADILQDTDQATTNTTNALSHANVNNVDRFQLLRDHQISPPVISAYTAAGNFTVQQNIDPLCPTFKFDSFVKLKGLTTQYKADSAPAVIGDIASGALYLVTYGSVAAASNSYSLTATVRLRFEDA